MDWILKHPLTWFIVGTLGLLILELMKGERLAWH